MDAPQGYLESFLAALYLMGVTIAGYIGWAIIKLFKFITPKASRVVAKIVSEWIIETLKPAISEAIDEKFSKKFDEKFEDIEKIKRATHGKVEREEGVLNRLLEIAEHLEKKIENEKDKS